MISAKHALSLVCSLAIVVAPNRARAQRSTSGGDFELRNAIAELAAGKPRPVRVSGGAQGRLEGERVAVLGDSLILTTESGLRTIAIEDVDSVWIQRGTAAKLFGIIAAVPCAIYGALLGSFLGGDPDSNGSPGREVGLTAAGIAAGAIICGSIGAAVGSAIQHWELEYARAAT